MLVWMDLEMTGLDHTSDVIVEIATIVTDDDLTIIAEGPDLVIHQPDEVLATMDPFVVDMHTKSGLLEQIKASEISLEAAGAATLEFIKQHVPEPASVPLCGNSIGTDRRFLAAYLPDIENHLHYRSIDVSSVKELVKRWYPGIDADRPRGQGSHRALDDIRESIREMAYYRKHVFVPRAAAAAGRRSPDDRIRLGLGTNGPSALNTRGGTVDLERSRSGGRHGQSFEACVRGAAVAVASHRVRRRCRPSVSARATVRHGHADRRRSSSTRRPRWRSLRRSRSRVTRNTTTGNNDTVVVGKGQSSPQTFTARRRRLSDVGIGERSAYVGRPGSRASRTRPTTAPARPTSIVARDAAVDDR